MVDLDALEQAVRNDQPIDTPKSLVLRLVAELRAARDAVEFTRKAAGYFHGTTHGDAAAEVVAAYDKVAGEGA